MIFGNHGFRLLELVPDLVLFHGAAGLRNSLEILETARNEGETSWSESRAALCLVNGPAQIYLFLGNSRLNDLFPDGTGQLTFISPL